MRYEIDTAVFEQFPDFRRVVIIAHNIDNTKEEPELASLLLECEEEARKEHLEDYWAHPRLAAWADAFRTMGLNPKKYPPSVINLVKRVRGGKNLPYINSLVAAFNCISLRYLCPCGGDDIAAIKGGLTLTYATGNETYTPLGQPEVKEHPQPNEIIYMDSGTKDVFCRGWCWKNGDTSKLGTSTQSAIINVDAFYPMTETDALAAATELSELLQRFTHATTEIRLISKAAPGFDF